MDVIVAASNQEITAARQATTTIPIVMMFGAAPVEFNAGGLRDGRLERDRMDPRA